jgi:hypothetical protein
MLTFTQQNPLIGFAKMLAPQQPAEPASVSSGNSTIIWVSVGLLGLGAAALIMTRKKRTSAVANRRRRRSRRSARR